MASPSTTPAKQAPYVRGSQDIHDNQQTFQMFWDATVGGVIGIALLMLILAYFFG